MKINFKHLNIYQSLLACLFMSLFYVISLYLWSKKNRFNRNDASVIKRRFISVVLTCFISLSFIYMISSQQHNYTTTNRHLNEIIGFEFKSVFIFLKAIILPLILTAILFTGPIVQTVISNYIYSEFYSHRDGFNLNKFYHLYLISNLKYFFTFKNLLKIICDNFFDLIFLRNYIISPFTEEFVFRSCMIPLLVDHLSNNAIIFTTPLFFGMAHLHHIIEGYILNENRLIALCAQSMFQFTYTYLFGAYSCFLFIKTNSVITSFVCHSFCNLMGFPDLVELKDDFNGIIKYIIIIFYFIGFFLFIFLLPIVTQPSLYGN
jgi:prenyl protein peptidase